MTFELMRKQSLNVRRISGMSLVELLVVIAEPNSLGRGIAFPTGCHRSRQGRYSSDHRPLVHRFAGHGE